MNPLVKLRADARVSLPRRRKMFALAVATASDLIRVVFYPAFIEGAASPLDVALDVVTAGLILFVAGAQWRLAIALAAELVPGLDLFPTWTAVVLSLPSKEPEAEGERSIQRPEVIGS
jgi:hypothetical protein